ncbi:MAG: 3-hydroxyacyl-CoA dehydrogenase family protein [Chlorobi bacterium]|nr:3-hydroxyacyl-CoA dehydrogenase family protein [Chlorobiota bacterium]
MMNFNERLQKVAILGAAGKMGSGILLLITRLMTSVKLEKPGYHPTVFAIDVSEERLQAVMEYIKKQSLKYAQKNAEMVSAWFPGNDTEETSAKYAREVLDCIQPVTDTDAANDAHVVFEAVNENKDLKTGIFRRIEQHNPHHPFYLTNTSSVPIHLLDEGAGLDGRIIGFHFYNPPAVQKLVEMIATQKTLPGLRDFALELAKRLRKVVVPSNDVAGFIGNGHFMRDVLYGFSVVRSLKAQLGFPGAVLLVDIITREYLIRPMGIFQLSDYVGLDVVQFILSVMDPHMPDEELHADELDDYLADGIKGGQHPDGSQKDGIFSYGEGKIAGVYDPGKKEYIPLKDIEPAVRKFLGNPPEGWRPWKEVIRDPEKGAFLEQYFAEMKRMEDQGAKIALAYGMKSAEIARKLVTDGVAQNEEDVNTVMLTGFYHAYGPVNQYL